VEFIDNLDELFYLGQWANAIGMQYHIAKHKVFTVQMFIIFLVVLLIVIISMIFVCHTFKQSLSEQIKKEAIKRSIELR
jgi:hypothetical protein